MDLINTDEQPFVNLKDFTILIVEDEEVALKTMHHALCSKVKQCYSARDGREGYFSFAKHDPDIVITDIVMPKMTGLEMAKAIRTKKPQTPIVLVTNFEDVDYLKQAIELKIDGFVLKPIEPEALLQTLEKCAASLRSIQELAERKRLTDLMLDFLPHPAMLVDGPKRRVLKTNLAARELGYEDGSACQGPLFPATLLEPYRPDESSFRSYDGVRVEEVNAFDRIWEVSIIPINQFMLFYNAVDVTQRKMTEMALESQATMDELTRLPNRFVLLDRLERALSLAKRYGVAFAVLYVDLDYFKQVNDTMGHSVGDEVLRQAAERISERIRDSDTVARLGGDEFCVIVQNLKNGEDSKVVARSIIEALRKPFLVQGQLWRLGASIGVSLCPDDGLSADELLQKADTAMYRAKAEGRNTTCFYSSSCE